MAIAAPNNDLNLIKSLLNYKVIDESIAEVALQKLKNHLWYLSPELTLLSLFDKNVKDSVKNKIVQSFKSKLANPEEEIPKKFDASELNLVTLKDVELDYFTNNQSPNFFKRFNIDSEFLSYDCSKWHKRRSYNNA